MCMLYGHMSVLLDVQHPMGVGTAQRNLTMKYHFRVKGETIQVIVFIIYVLSYTCISVTVIVYVLCTVC